MALTDLLNPDDPYRKSLESALYGRQADVVNTQADQAQTNARENAFSRGVGFSSILPEYSTAPIERERLRALTNASQNAFLGSGQEARANAQATNQPLQFAQSQAQQAGQFNRMMQQQRQQLAQQANQNLVASLGGGALGLSTLLLRPQPAESTTLGGNLVDWLGQRTGQGVDYLSSLMAPSGGASGATDVFGNLSTSFPDIISSSGMDTGGQAAVDPEIVSLLSQLFGGPM